MARTAHVTRTHRSEQGQVLFMVAALLAVIGGLVAIAVDVGSFAAERRDLQNAADAIALAASRELPNQDAARNVAEDWAEKNGVAIEDMQLTFVQQSLPAEPNPKIIVQVARDHDFVFARLVGITSKEVSAKATSIRTSPAGGDGVVPLSVTQAALSGVTYGDVATLKYDAQNISQGNTSPIRIDSPGGGNCSTTDNWCRGVVQGSQNTVCASGTDLTYCSGPTQVQTETGNKVGGTRSAINNRIDRTDVHCDQFTEVFEDDPTTTQAGVYSIAPDCNPFLAGGYESGRVLIIPVIQQLCNGSCTVTIVDFALFFLEGFSAPNSCTGNNCEVIGRFVRVNQNVGLLAGTFNQQASNTFVRLVD